MGKFIDLTGKRFSKLLVIKKSHKDKWDQWHWKCKCLCNNITIVSGANLRKKVGHTKSCGCLSKYSKGKASCHALYLLYKSSANIRNLEFAISFRYFKKLIKQNCFYCGIKPKQRYGQHKHNGPVIYNGIDRIDNNKGYIINNLVPCCKICNRAKNNLTYKEFKNWINSLIIYQNKGNLK